MKKTIFVLGVAGVLFSGYMSGVKFFSKTCAFNETCPYFLGHPACYYGFAMFLAIMIFAGLLVWRKIKENQALNIIIAISLLGILFAGYFTMGELPLLFKNGFSAYVFGLPTCGLGLIFYIAVFVFSYLSRFGKQTMPSP
jgi:uncharacterized membrane protein